MRYIEQLNQAKQRELKEKKGEMLLLSRLIGAFNNGGEENQKFLDMFVAELNGDTPIQEKPKYTPLVEFFAENPDL